MAQFSMAQSYTVAGDLARQSQDTADPGLPSDVTELIKFLRTATSLGTQVAFWRSRGQLQLLQSVSYTLRAVSLSAQSDITNIQLAKAQLAAYSELLLLLDRIVEAVPFRSKVGLFRRNLIGTFQQVFILRHLCQSIVCRLMCQLKVSVRALPAGSLLSPEWKHDHRELLQPVAVGWDQEYWNIYDYL